MYYSTQSYRLGKVNNSDIIIHFHDLAKLLYCQYFLQIYRAKQYCDTIIEFVSNMINDFAIAFFLEMIF